MDIRKPANRQEHREALKVLLGRPHMAAEVVEERLGMLEAYVERKGLSLEECLIACDAGRIAVACVALDSPGRTSTILLSGGLNAKKPADAAAALLKQAQPQAAGRGMKLMQGLVAPEVAHESGVYAAAGFQHLATLLYMQSNLRGLSLPTAKPDGLEWVAYGPHTHSVFCRVIEASYEGSLDCACLNGVRDIEDIIASHKATGRFDPAMWLVAMSAGQPVGVLLLALMEEHQTLEVVYMGLLPAFRRRGVGTSILLHGTALARQKGLVTMTLSMDSRNAPAARLYGHFGFQETMRREVWIALL